LPSSFWAVGGGGYCFWTQQQAKHLESAAEASEPAVALQFYAPEPAFVTNFEGVQAFRFLQIQVRRWSGRRISWPNCTEHDPMIRNDLLMLFSQQNAEFLGTVEGKEKLRKDALEIVRKNVSAIGGRPKKVENVLFTSFVMQ
jgi:flagellar FliL protein